MNSHSKYCRILVRFQLILGLNNSTTIRENSQNRAVGVDSNEDLSF